MGNTQEMKSRCDGKVIMQFAAIALSCLLLTFVLATDLYAAGSYTISATAGSGGSISPSGAVSVKNGGNQTFTISPSTGYDIDKVTVDSVSQGAITTYTFSNVRANHTIIATFKMKTFVINSSHGSGGLISPQSAGVNYGDSLIAYIMPYTGYHIVDVKVDGVSQGPITTYTFTNITANHTISATFAINTYTLTATAGSGGTVSPATATVNHGGSQIFTITPDTSYHVADVTIDSYSVGAVSNYTFSNVQTNHTIAATFAINTYTVTATAGKGGSISPSGTVPLDHGGSQTFTITPDNGYSFVNVTVDGVAKGALTGYTFTDVTANHMITAAFATSAPQPQSSADYFYDDLGRLTRVVQGTSGVIYNYDELGNLTSTTSATTTAGSPVLTAITPNVLLVGSKFLVTITGQNLLTTDSVTANEGLVTIDNVTVSDTLITAEMTALAAGTETITVATRNGTPNTASISVPLTASTLSLTPGQLALTPGSTGTIAVSVSPPLAIPLTINLDNSSPAVVSVPQTVTIPVSGSTDFTINTLQDGVVILDAGGARSVVFVAAPFSGDVNGLAAAGVSVYIEAPSASQSPSVALPVSVYLDAPSAGSMSSMTLPVSVYLEVPAAAPSTTTTRPVSVSVDAPVGDSPTMAEGVSVKIQ